MQQMSEMIYETQYAIRMLIDKKEQTEKFQLTVSKLVEKQDLFTVVCCLCALIAHKLGFKGNILSEPVQIHKVYGLNVKADVAKILEDMRQSEYYDHELDNYLDDIDIDVKEDVNRLFTEVIEFKKAVENKMFFASSIDEYRLYENVFNTILITEETNENFKMSDGEVAKTYIEYISDKDRDLGTIIDNIDDSEISDWIDSFINAILDIIPDMHYAYSMNDGDDTVIECLLQLCMFFKSYSADIVKLNTNFKLANQENKVKFLDDIHEIWGEITIKDILRRSFDNIIIDSELIIKDKSKFGKMFTEIIKFEYDD